MLFATSLFAKDQDPSAAAKQSSSGKPAASAQAKQPAQQNQVQQGSESAQAKTAVQPGQVIRHQGHWWFRQPNQQWVVWQNNAWTPYKAGMFPSANARTTRRYSYEPQLQSGYPTRGYYGSGYPRMYRAPGAFGSSRSIRYAGSKANFDYAPYTGGTVQ
jgi:hypothetical protein